MTKIQCFLLTSLLAAPLAAPAQVKTETFDTQASAGTDGWTGYMNQANGENFGWSNTSYAGGNPGEAGGIFVRNPSRAYYADTTIGTLSLNDYISVTGQITIHVPSSNATFNMGFFNTNDPSGSSQILGMTLADGNYPDSRLRPAISLAGASSLTYQQTGPQQLLPQETNYFTFTYDPNGGVNEEGELTFIYTSNGSTWTNAVIDLSASDRATGASFNAFGLLMRGAGSATNTMGIFMDNLTYSVESSCIFERANGTSMVVGENDRDITITIPDNATSGGPVSVDLVSTNPAVAYPDGASGGTLTVTFPQDSPYTMTNVPITAVAFGSTLFYLNNATGGACISGIEGSNIMNVVCGTVSLTPSTLTLGEGQSNQSVMVAITSGLNVSGPVTVSIDSSNPSVATPQTSTVTFAQGGPISTNIIINALTTPGTTTLSLSSLVGGGCADLTGSTLVTVTCNPITISPSAMVSLVGQNSQVLTVNIPSYANASGAVTVDLKSLNPSVVAPQGAVGDTLSLTFPAGGTNNLYVPLDVLGYGTATLVLTNNASAVDCSYITNGAVVITVPVPDGTNNMSEAFDSQAQAASDGWMGFMNQANGEDYGWSDTANAGGTPGEAGGNLVRFSGRSYYADVTVGPLSLNDYISASGVLIIAPPSTDAAFNIAYFNTNNPAGSQNVLGIGLADGTYPSQRISIAVDTSDGTTHETFGPAQLVAGVPVNWSFNYAPTAGATGNGQLTLNYTVNGTPYTTNYSLSASYRVTGATFNAFGILDRGISTDINTPMGVFMDNVTYTKGYSLAPPSIPLELQSVANTLTFTWANTNFSLASSTNVTGPYIKIPGASSPFITNTSGSAGFFRLVWP